MTAKVRARATLTEDRMHVIAQGKMDELRDDVDKDHSKLEDKVDDNTTEIKQIRETQLTMKGTVDSMYGNGSGRKGMLERMDEGHKEFRREMTDKFNKETSHQAKFRHEIRDALETVNLQLGRMVAADGSREKVNKSWMTWAKFFATLLGGFGLFLLQEWLKKNVFHP